MTFTIETWRERAGRKLQQTGQWLGQRGRTEAPYLIYGTVAGLTIWPLVEEAVRTGQLWSVMVALGGVAGGVGGNLIAEQLQRWHDQAEPPAEADITAWVQQEIAGNENLRAAVDAILEQLDAIPQAQASLSESDRAWFVRQLQAELAQLGSLKRFEATLIGSGAIAQGDGAKAVGEGGVLVEGNVQGSVMTGQGHRHVQAQTYVEKQEIMSGPPTAEPNTLRAAYLHRLLVACNALSLAGVDRKAASDAETRFDLDAVYTALLTTTVSQELEHRPRRGETLLDGRRLSAVEQLNRNPRLVLLGDPGSGKSTFVNFVAACLAAEGIGRPEIGLRLLTAPLPDDEGNDQDERQPWTQAALLPVRVILRDFAARGLPPAGEPATAAHLWRFIQADLAGAAQSDFAPLLHRELLQQGGLLLLDGLDEVPEADSHRVQLRQVVEAFAAAFPKVRILVTSRTYAYQQQEWRLDDFVEAVLAPFTPGQIRRFVDRWYTYLGQRRGLHLQDAQGRAERLKQAIFGSDRLQGLAERPLLLTLMSSLHAWRGGSLPEKREELYADAVDLLLDWWESQRVVNNAEGKPVLMQPSLAEWLKVDRAKVRGLLNRLAFEAHASQPTLQGTADIAEAQLVTGLLQLSANPDAKPARLVEYLRDRAGLLLPRGVGVYTFPHRTFQEYLAACHLTDQEYPDQIAGLARSAANRWREVALLAGAKAARGAASTIWSLVDALCYQDVARAGGDPADTWGAHLAGQALLETADLNQPGERNVAKVQRVRDWLVAIVGSDWLPAVERAVAGVNLAYLGDPRPAVMTVAGMEFCYVPAGPFWLGSGDDDDLADDDEKQQHEVNLAYPYWLGRYPVSNAQFGEFVAAGGYQKTTYWTEAETAGFWTKGGVKGRWDDAPRSGPADSGAPFNLPNHPVVEISWYEALAFGRWLTQQGQAAGWLPAGWQITLPSEAEWEKAARGGWQRPVSPLTRPFSGLGDNLQPAVALAANEQERRRYPWGDDPDPNRANFSETAIGATSALGCFPTGRSLYGCEEMGGNIWQWTRSQWRDYPYRPSSGREVLTAGPDVGRVIRSGSFANDERGPRCSFRDWSLPYYFLWNLGFRVAVSPALHL